VTAPVFGRCIIELESLTPLDPAVSVAVDDVLAVAVGRGEAPPTLRLWQNQPALIVPMSRLKHTAAGTAIDVFGHRWPLCGRASGGGAVAHGPGTLNMSIIMPLRKRLEPSIDDSFRLWIAILDAALKEAYSVSVDIGSVEGAFCKGSYDGVVGGRKIAGTAQARRRGSVVVHGTILTNVDPARYVTLIGVADRLSRASHASPSPYDAGQIVSLHELVGRVIPHREVATAVCSVVGIDEAALDASGRLSRSEQLAARQLAAERHAIGSSRHSSVHPYEGDPRAEHVVD
jgi:lipoate-protein ligase A